MSDGHFNRALLPHNDFRSGLRAGMATQKKRCREALQEALDKTLGEGDSDTKKRILTTYSSLLG